MNKKISKNYFTNQMFKKLIVPTIFSSVVMGLAETADAVVIGQKMGEAGLAIVGLVLPVYMFINIIAYGFSVGGSIKYGVLIGESKRKEAREQYNSVFMTVLICGIFFAVLGNLLLPQILNALGANRMSNEVFDGCKVYLRILVSGFPILLLSYLMNYYMCNDNNQVLASGGFITGSAVDFILNIVFVIVLDYGAVGAAAATVLGQAIVIIIYMIGLKLKKYHNLKLTTYKITKARIAMSLAAFKNGFSTSVQYLWQLIFILLVNRALILRLGEREVAIFDVIQNVLCVAFYFYEGVGKAMQPIVSVYHGERDKQGCKYIKKLSLTAGTLIGGVVTAVVIIFAKQICRIMGITDGETIALTISAIRIVATSIMIGGISVLLTVYHQASEEVGPVWVIGTLRTAAVLIPCAILMIFVTGYKCWWFYLITEALSFLLYNIWRVFHGEKNFDPERIYSKIIKNDSEDLGVVLAEVEEFGNKWGANPKQIYYINMAVEEMCGIIINKAFSESEQGYIRVTIIALEEGDVELHLIDNANYFNPFKNEDNCSELDMLGVNLIKKTAKTFSYIKYQGFNTLNVKM